MLRFPLVHPEYDVEQLVPRRLLLFSTIFGETSEGRLTRRGSSVRVRGGSSEEHCGVCLADEAIVGYGVVHLLFPHSIFLSFSDHHLDP